MHRLIIIAITTTTLGLAGCGDKEKKTAAEDSTCPTQAEVEAAITKHITTNVWSPGERDIWKITAVDSFTFSPIETGDIINKQVEYGAEPRPVCPVRLTYSYKTHHSDGRVDTEERGANQTHLFYPDSFHSWTFKTD